MLPAASARGYAGRALSRQVTMMVDSEPTDRIESPTQGPDQPETDQPETDRPEQAGRRPSGRRVYRQGPVEDNAGWTIFSYLIAGMVFYGLIGWLVGRATHIAVLFPLGAITGLVLAIVLIIFRYGRP
jgi:ATP synthase protein I